MRPVEAGTKEAAGRIAQRHEWTGQAEKIAGAKYHQDQGAAKVHPGEDRGEIFRREGWT